MIRKGMKLIPSNYNQNLNIIVLKNFILIFFSFLFIGTTSAQKRIEGTVIYNNNQIENATIQILNPTDSSLIGYTFSAENGHFQIEINTQHNELLLLAKHLSYGEQSRIIINKNQFLTIALNGKVIEIPAVKINSSTHSIKGDTLTYILNAFANSKDRTLSDVLKKLPGVDVDANGAIKYNGRYINKFYVEGKDLMESRYGVITNTLPNTVIESVEILQNHQPLKILEGKTLSHETAFNIKLKKNITLSGRAEITTGGSPLLWGAKITPMLFAKNNQSIFDIKANNIGDDLLESYESIVIGNKASSDITKYVSTGEILKLNTPRVPELDKTKYFNNKSFLISANTLKQYKNNWEIKFNIDTWRQSEKKMVLKQ